MELHYCVPVWGRAYVAQLTDVSLPSLLAPGNLPALSRMVSVRLRIFTRSADARQIRESAIWPQLNVCVPVDIVTCDDLNLSEAYAGMSNLLQVGIRQAGAVGAAFVPQAADGFWSDGSFATLGRLLRAGKRLVLCGGVRVVTETFAPAAQARYGTPDGAIAISGRDMVDLALDHLHPSMGLYFNDSRLRAVSTSWWLRPYSRHSFVENIFHFVPLAVAGTGYDAHFNGTVDRGFVETLDVRPEEVALIDSSDDLTLVDLAPATRIIGEPQLAGVSDAVVTGRWFRDMGESHAFLGGRYYAKPIRFRGRDGDDPAVRRAERTAMRTSRRGVYQGLVVAEALAAADALRAAGWLDLAAGIRSRALTSGLALRVGRLTPYTAVLPADPSLLPSALDDLARRIRTGRAHSPPAGALAGPIDTGLGDIYILGAM
ncbi:hypothetical protein [Azospirillum sp. B4]|uniref:hypothetical protein n=1 Tax=Azospirillum sp. B4 TaxID=95605 RepID=UPI00034C484C|nr:hypothetical protein [Azospirillum sp. B4]